MFAHVFRQVLQIDRLDNSEARLEKATVPEAPGEGNVEAGADRPGRSFAAEDCQCLALDVELGQAGRGSATIDIALAIPTREMRSSGRASP